jgi:hypothetical protein
MQTTIIHNLVKKWWVSIAGLKWFGNPLQNHFKPSKDYWFNSNEFKQIQTAVGIQETTWNHNKISGKTTAPSGAATCI